jgi:hypothetical protein
MEEERIADFRLRNGDLFHRENPQSAGRDPRSENPLPAIRHPQSEAASLFLSVFRRLKPRTAPPAFDLQFRPFADVNHTVRVEDGRVVARLSDLLTGAPAAVLESLAFILLCKLYRRPVPARYNERYRRFLNRKDVRRQAELMRQARGRKQLAPPQGAVYNLEEIFQEINSRYFHGLLGMPLLGWSRSRSRTMLGHFDPAHNTITMSRLFDSESAPRYVLEYLMYHEMLHLKYPVEHGPGRRRVHPLDFQQEEKRFPRYEEARRALKKL